MPATRRRNRSSKLRNVATNVASNVASKKPPKAWIVHGGHTISHLTNSLARKIGRGEIEIGQEVHGQHTGLGILPNGRSFVIHVNIVFSVDIAREVTNHDPAGTEQIEVKPVRE